MTLQSLFMKALSIWLWLCVLGLIIIFFMGSVHYRKYAFFKKDINAEDKYESKGSFIRQFVCFMVAIALGIACRYLLLIEFPWEIANDLPTKSPIGIILISIGIVLVAIIEFKDFKRGLVKISNDEN